MRTEPLELLEYFHWSELILYHFLFVQWCSLIRQGFALTFHDHRHVLLDQRSAVTILIAVETSNAVTTGVGRSACRPTTPQHLASNTMATLSEENFDSFFFYFSKFLTLIFVLLFKLKIPSKAGVLRMRQIKNAQAQFKTNVHAILIATWMMVTSAALMDVDDCAERKLVGTTRS